VENITTNNLNQLTVYPSPATDILHIKGDKVDYTVIDLRSGAVMIEGFGNTIDVSKLTAGVYVIEADGKMQRFIKK